MATATRRGQFWSARWRDATGRWREKRTKCRTKTEALVLARDLEHKADRQRLGLEPLPDRRAAMSFDELFSWWWKEYGRRRRSPADRECLRVGRRLGGLPRRTRKRPLTRRETPRRSAAFECRGDRI
jgi:hypothetical protein